MSDILFAQKDSQTIVNEIIALYEAAAGYTLSPGDPRRLFLMSIALVIIQLRARIDDTGKRNLLRYAVDEDLDELGDDRNTPRFQATKAKTTLRFTISAPQLSVVPVPQGTRAAVGGKVFFATIGLANIPIGQTTIDVTAECTEAGTVGNNYLAGQINQSVDVFPFMVSVTNTTKSTGGTDKEDNDVYRERIRQAPEAYSTAGPRDGYSAMSKNAYAGIIDVLVHSPSEGTVEIRPLMDGGELPTQDVLDAVLAACSDRKKRPLTDHVTADFPDTVTYDIEINYYINADEAARTTEIQGKVSAAIDDYILWQRSKLGRGVDPSELIARIKGAGASRVAVTLPVYTALEAYQVAVPGEITTNYGGLEDA